MKDGKVEQEKSVKQRLKKMRWKETVPQRKERNKGRRRKDKKKQKEKQGKRGEGGETRSEGEVVTTTNRSGAEAGKSSKERAKES